MILVTNIVPNTCSHCFELIDFITIYYTNFCPWYITYYEVADLYNIFLFDKVTITKVPKWKEPSIFKSATAYFVTGTITDQLILHGEMFQFQNSFLGKYTFEGERDFTPLVSYYFLLLHNRWIVFKILIST